MYNVQVLYDNMVNESYM